LRRQLRNQRGKGPHLDQGYPPIAAGEEITYDYCLYDGGVDEALCNCGAKNCRGTMYSKEEVKRRKAAVKKALKLVAKKSAAKVKAAPLQTNRT